MAALRFMLSLLMIPITLFIALSSITGALAVYVHPETSWAIAILGLLLPVTLTMNLLLCIYWAIKKKEVDFRSHRSDPVKYPLSFILIPIFTLF